MTVNIAAKVRELRTKLGLNQQNFGLKLGYSSGAMISKIEAGQRIPHWDVLQKMAKLAKVSMDYFLEPEVSEKSKAKSDSYLAFLKFQQMVLKDGLPDLKSYLQIKYNMSSAEVAKFEDLQRKISGEGK